MNIYRLESRVPIIKDNVTDMLRMIKTVCGSGDLIVKDQLQRHASRLDTCFSSSPSVALLQSGFSHRTGGRKAAERKKKKKGCEWGRGRGECDNCWMRTECVRLATLPLGRPRLLHLSLSVSAARRSLGESDAAFSVREGAQRRRRTHTHTHGTVGSHLHRAGRQAT